MRTSTFVAFGLVAAAASAACGQQAGTLHAARSARNSAGAATAAGSRRRTDDGNLVDAAWIPEGGAGEQCDVAACWSRLGDHFYGRQEQIRRHDQHSEPG